MSKAYPKYKPSGVEWLGDVPEHWGVKKLKHTAYLYGRIGFRGYTTEDLVDEGEGAITLSPSNMRDGALHLEKSTYISWEKYYESPEIMIKPNDVVIVKTGSTFGKIAFVEKVEHPITLNPQLAVFKRLKCNNRFFFYYIGAPYIQDQISLSNTGSTIPTMTQQTIMSYAIPLPPLPEQQAIAAFLDRETGRIDALIAKKERLLELLAEQRTALISHAVTKGLDASVKLKPSGVEWLGVVPEHWEVKKLKWSYQGIGSGDGISPDDIDTTGTYPVYGGNGIMGYTEAFNSNHTDIIIGRVGAKCGNVYIVYGPKWISDNALKIKINRVDLNYLALLLEHRNLNQLANQNAQPLITGSMVGNQFLPFPPLPEQQVIAAFLGRETAKIDALSTKVTAVIERLKEYRTALISSAVTGKIDVREAV